ncbi:serine/threonine protein kinase [Streptomyces sp. NPDC005236]|uniref:protein kinase domain-containing protein n=1 Tax=Streptomyces sp. NPDC005236 TaxID=3157028 RepID=UPI0033B20D42
MAKAQDSTGELIAGRYRLLDVLLREEGRVLWHGEDIAFGRPVVLTRSGAAGDPGEETPGPAADRILGTAKILGPACHGGVAAVLEVAEEPGFVWTVTERPPGTPLTELLVGGRVDHVRAAVIGLGVLDVLTAAHHEGVAHGELGPSQVWADEHGTVTVTGFGLTPSAAAPRTTAPSYASPEQARGESGAPPADLWALGAMMYELVEGRPVVRDRGDPQATLRAVDRLPVRAPRHAGPLAPAILGLLRWDPVERVPEAVVREALTRILRQNFEEVTPPEPLPDLLDPVGDRGGDAEGEGPRRPGRTRGGRLPAGRPVLLGAALTVTVVAVGVFALMGGLPGTDDTSASGPAPSRAAADASASVPGAAGTPTATPTATPSGRTPTASSKPSPSPSPTAGATLPSGFSLYRAPQGFTVALPVGWKPVETQSSDDLAYRVTFGASGDPRTLAVTYSTQLGPDPVAVWSALEPSLRAATTGYERVGAIQPVTYHGMKGADMEWYSVSGGVRVRTLGRGFLIGDHRGFSLRWTTPADDWDSAADRQALRVVLDSFRTGVK